MNSEDTTTIKLISHKGKFKPSSNSFSEFLDKNDASDLKNFYMVSVMGGQSGGKSTLLNCLFNTKFAVLPIGERRATTKGIEIAFAENHNDNCRVLLMDLEGSDSSEKSESEGESFARKSALFALALSEILIVNVWSHDIGKRSAVNLSILRSVFEVSLRLSDESKPTKTKILFVMRDHDASLHGSIQMIQDILWKELIKLWNSLEKPSYFKDLELEEMFDFAFIGLPHKKYKNDAFLREMFELKKQFSPIESPVVLENHTPCKMKGVPIKELFNYLSYLWKSVDSVEDLNIGSQKEALTSKICEKAFDDCASIFVADSQQFADVSKWKSFGIRADSLFKKTEEEFVTKVYPDKNSIAENGSRDNPVIKIRDKWRSKLVNAMSKELLSHQLSHYAQLQRDVSCSHKIELSNSLKDEENALKNFEKIKKELRDKKTMFIQAKISDEIHLKCIDYNQLTKTPPEFIQILTRNEEDVFFELVKILKKRLINVFKREASTVAETYCKGGEYVWDNVQKILTKMKDISIKTINDFSATLNPSEKIEKWTNDFKSEIAKIFISDVIEELKRRAELTDQRLNREFDALFRMDENGSPRDWEKHKKDMRSEWTAAKEKCYSNLKLYAQMDKGLTPNHEPLQLIPKERLDLIRRSFDHYAEIILRDAETQRKMNQSNIPLWIYFVMLILGWNEIVWVLKSPILLVLIIALGSYYWIWGFDVYRIQSVFVQRILGQRSQGSEKRIK